MTETLFFVAGAVFGGGSILMAILTALAFQDQLTAGRIE
jgi:hypothetical protein